MTVLIYDSLGVGHNVNLEWTKTVAAPPTWRCDAASVPRADNGAASVQGAPLASLPRTLETGGFHGGGPPGSFKAPALPPPTDAWTTEAEAGTDTAPPASATQPN